MVARITTSTCINAHTRRVTKGQQLLVKIQKMKGITFALILLVFQQLLCQGQARGGKTCTYKNGGKEYQINEGDVTKIKKTKIRVCENEKLF